MSIKKEKILSIKVATIALFSALKRPGFYEKNYRIMNKRGR